MFILMVSTIIYYKIFNTTGHFKDVELADRLYSIADSFENYALISYSKNVNIAITLKPVGVKNYTIYFADKQISVDAEKLLCLFPPLMGLSLKEIMKIAEKPWMVIS
jgi:hypothetical protein